MSGHSSSDAAPSEAPAMESSNEEYALALQVVELAKALVVSDNHFLSAAIGQLGYEKANLDAGSPTVAGASFATDARVLKIDPRNLLVRFMQDEEPPRRDLLHSILHCVFLHPFVDIEIRQPDWNLACDIACELLVAQICGSRKGVRGSDIEHALKKVASKLDGPVTAERVYAALRDGKFDADKGTWESLFASDDHSPWYAGRARGAIVEDDDIEDDNEDEFEGGGGCGSGMASDEMRDDGANANEGLGESPSAPPDPGSSEQPDDEQDDREQGQSSSAGDDKRIGDEDGSDEEMVDARARNRQPLAMRIAEETATREAWRKVGKSIGVNLRTLSKKLGEGYGDLLESLDDTDRQTVDYRDFLRKFAVPSEVMKISDDEFDTVFYTYGLSLYRNMPLIEPLENRIDKRIRDFVIALDTSGSVYGEQVRTFVALTYDILKSTETFDEKVKVVIMQCDTKIRHIDVVDTLDELRRWCGQMQVFGGGGTDFRPVFECVDSMVEEGELHELGGLIYFTDGFGTYPEWVPDYKTAFVFCDEGGTGGSGGAGAAGAGRDENSVPPWAMQVVLDPAQTSTTSWRDICGHGSVEQPVTDKAEDR